MKVTTALLAEHVTVREGLLYVVAGGATTLTRPSYPSPASLMLGLILAPDLETDLGKAYQLEIEVLFGRQSIAKQGGSLQIDRRDDSGPIAGSGQSAIAIDLRGLEIKEPGHYRVVVRINGRARVTLYFTAVIGEG